MKNKFFSSMLITFMLTGVIYSITNSGYWLWLKYDLISDASLLDQYKNLIRGFILNEESPSIQAAKNELQNGLNGLLGSNIQL